MPSTTPQVARSGMFSSMRNRQSLAFQFFASAHAEFFLPLTVARSRTRSANRFVSIPRSNGDTAVVGRGWLSSVRPSKQQYSTTVIFLLVLSSRPTRHNGFGSGPDSAVQGTDSHRSVNSTPKPKILRHSRRSQCADCAHPSALRTRRARP